MEEVVASILGIIEDNTNSKVLYFTKRVKDSYISYCPEVDPIVMDDIVNHAKNFISNFSEHSIVSYNPTGYREGTVEICSIDFVGCHNLVVESFEPETIEINKDDIDKFLFYCIVFDTHESNLKLYRRITKFKKLSAHGVCTALRGNRLTKIEGSLLGIDGCIDLIEYNDQIYILNHTSLERVFDLQNEFTRNAEQALDILKKGDGIQNIIQFREDCLNNRKVMKTLTRMMGEKDMLEKCFDNFDNIIEAITMFELDLEVTTSGKRAIVYADKSQIYDILRIASDAYYKSIVREQLGIDNMV